MFGDFPQWLHVLAIGSLALGALCAITIALDELRHPQDMWIMNVVWPLTALFGSVLWTAGYYRWGRTTTSEGDETPQLPFSIAVAKGASHCGAGCTLGDLLTEWAAFAFPSVAVWFGWTTLFSEKTFAVWIPDFLVAFAIGIVFQYYTIKPMRDLSPLQGIVAAVKADLASIASWQIGMYGLMAIIQFGWYRADYGGIASVASPEFWFAMQLAMLAGFCTAYPTNWALIRAGFKERM